VSSGDGINKFKHWRGQRNTWGREKCQLKLRSGIEVSSWVKLFEVVLYLGATSHKLYTRLVH
jgi:hypothetical protein